MKDKVVKILKKDAALAVAQNFRYFGYPCRGKLLGRNKVAVAAPRWAWSFVVLTKEDFA